MRQKNLVWYKSVEFTKHQPATQQESQHGYQFCPNTVNNFSRSARLFDGLWLSKKPRSFNIGLQLGILGRRFENIMHFENVMFRFMLGTF